MKISKIIDELTELKEYLGDKDLEACIANDATTGVNVMYQNDDGGMTSTSLEGEKMVSQLKATMIDQEGLHRTGQINPLATEVQKVDWLNNEINRLEGLLESGCTDAENVEYSIQMFRELLSTKMAHCRANAVKKIKDNICRDVAEFLKDFGNDLTDAEKASIKSLTCLQIS